MRAVDRAFRVLHALSQIERDVDLATLAKQTDLPKSTLARLLHTMKLHNAVQQDSKSRRDRLGWGLIHLGKAAKRQFELERVVLPYLKQLARETGETASFAVLEGDRAADLAQVLTNSIIRGAPPIGAELHLHCTAVGKVLLTSFADEQFDGLIRDHGLPRATDRTIVNSQQLRTETEKVAQLGIRYRQQGSRAGRAVHRHADSERVWQDHCGDFNHRPNRPHLLGHIEEYAEVVKRIATRVAEAPSTLAP